MIDISKGRYWDEGIQLIDGCTPCSPGCDHCWSAARAHRFRRGICFDGKVDLSVTNYTDKNGRFDGRIKCNPDRLSRFNTRKPKVFACWNDLFHEDVPTDFINSAFLHAWPFRQNTYLVLTKRAERLRDILITGGLNNFCLDNFRYWDNLYFGLTVCNQQEADEKIPIFLQVPGKKFLSIEPMLGPVEIFFLHLTGYSVPDMYDGQGRKFPAKAYDGIDAVILGGETGPGARPMHPDWVRSVRDQCAAVGVPFFFKQWGEWLPFDQREAGQLRNSVSCKNNGWAWKIGRNKAGRFLDGRTHDALPWVNK